MNIHAQQTDCEAEIAAGTRGPGLDHPTTACWTVVIHLDERMTTSAKLHICCQVRPQRRGGPIGERIDTLNE